MEENPLWLVVLCDMMTNLMLFFLMLYAYVRYAAANLPPTYQTYAAGDVVDKAPRSGETVPGLPMPESPEAQALRASLEKAGLESRPEIEVAEREIRVRLRERLLFELGRSELSPEAGKTLAPLARVLGDMPGNRVIVEGHTDSVPIVGGPYLTNWELSVARSYSVLAALLERGIPPQRMVASGYGELHPVASNAEEAGRGLNRRVEIVIQRSPEDGDE